MTTSNSYDFEVTRDQIIDLAHQHVGAIGEGESASPEQVTEASRLINMIIKLRAADGMPLWALKRATILPVTGVSAIATDSHVVTTYDTTTIGADEAAAQTVISVTSSTAMTALDQIGIELDDATMHWTTIVSVDSPTQITITDPLSDSAAAGNRIYSYTASTDRVQKPLRILETNIQNLTTNSRYEIDQISRQEYFMLGGHTSASVPNQVYYDLVSTSNTNLNNGQIYVYPRFSGADNVVEFTYHRPFQDLDAAGDTLDFPQAFYLPIMIELAYLLAAKFGVPIDIRKVLFQEAAMYREEALSTIYPEGSLRIVPDQRWGD